MKTGPDRKRTLGLAARKSAAHFPLGAYRLFQLCVVGLVCFLTTLFIAFFVQSHERQTENYRLAKTAEEVLIDLENTLQETLTTPLFLQAFYASSKSVDRGEFRTYTRSLLERRPFIQALEWVPVVSGESRGEYEKNVREEGYPDYQIQEVTAGGQMIRASEREHYHPIHYIEPENDNKYVMGFDLASEPKRRTALHNACKTGNIAVSPLIDFFQKPGKHGFFIAAPFIRGGSCEGVLGAMIKLDDITEKILADIKDQNAVYTLIITEDLSGEKLDLHPAPSFADPGDAIPHDTMSLRRQIAIGEELWIAEIRFRPIKKFSAYGFRFWFTLGGGILLTGLLLLYLRLLMHYSKEVEWTVQQRTQELEHTKTVLEGEIEENLKAQQLLSKTERSYRQILDAITDMVLVKGPNSRILWANQAFCNYYGMTAEQLKDLIDSPIMPPDQTKQFIRDDEKVFRGGVPLNIPSEAVTRHDGEIRFFHTVKSPIFDKDGKVIQSVGVSRDISDRLYKEEKIQEMTDHLKRSEEKFRSLVLNIPGAIYRCAANRDWTMEFISESIQELCGYPAEEIIQSSKRTFASLIHPEDREKVEKRVFEALKEKKPYTLEYRICHADGSIRFVYEKGQGVFSESGEVLCLDGGIFDITERKNWEKQMQQAQKLEAVGKLAGGIAHDFNNQLMVIGGYCNLILSQIPQESPMHSQLLDIKAAADKSSQLTRQLLALGRKQMIKPKIMNPNQSIRQITQMIQTLVGVKIDYRMELQEGLLPILMDPQQFEQSFINLVLNARDAMPQGGRLTVRTFAKEEKDGTQTDVIEIEDTGAGMSPDVRSHLFEPFFTTKDRAKGSGLGLATCYAMVQEASGLIEVQSEIGQGSLFRMIFPGLKQEPDTHSAPVEVKKAERNFAHILLVDDESAVRGVVAAILKTRGYRVSEASSGEEALLIAKNQISPVDLLISDIMMPGMDGRQLVAKFCALYPETPTLFISGYADKFSKDDIKETPLLEKPFNPEALVKKVSEIFEAQKIKQEALKKFPKENAS